MQTFIEDLLISNTGSQELTYYKLNGLSLTLFGFFLLDVSADT